ncbi:unannotated protein [freshwater metagenome]|uniref:Unannotated protein n=1 Tax=freshwater metagenome TaxID=449393 RepID=A0A6J6RPH8_9ZZZZ
MPDPRRVSRRTTLVGSGLLVAGAAAVAAHDSGETDSAAGGTSPDLMLIATARAEIDAIAALVQRARSRHPTLEARLGGLADLHTAHQAILERAAPTSSTPSTPPEPRVADLPADAWLQVLSQEDLARRSLLTSTTAARSGALAQVLASMSAGISQQLALLPAALPGPATAPAAGSGS